MKKFVVTGGAGFIGSNLVDKLLELKNEVIVIDNESSKSNKNFYWNNFGPKNYKFDLCDNAQQSNLIKILEDVDCVFHMAADISIPYCIENPLAAFKNNVNSLLNILEACRLSKVKRIVFSSTSAIYGLTEKICTETDVPDPLNPYSLSKLAGEQLIKMYYELYGLKGVSLRYFNVYGNRQPKTGQYAPVIGIFQNQKANGENLTIVGDGNQTRDFIHVSDVVNANITVATKDVKKYGEIYNVGTGKNYSIKQIADIISDKQIYIPPRPAEARMSLANIDKLKSTYQWEPKVKLNEWLSQL